MSESLVCRPTRWFYQRAFGMLAMFTFLGGWFFKDASTGYRQENLAFVMNRAFTTAAQTLLEKQKEGMLTADEWSEFAAAQSVNIGDDPSLLPAAIPQPLPWPEELRDRDLLAKGHIAAWEAFTGRMKWDRKAPEKFHEAGSIREQWYVGCGLSTLALYSLFILIRTSRRTIRIDADTLLTQDGRRVLLADLTRLDLRKWATKGMAYAYYPDPSGKEACVRIDGLTYGGFQKELGEPAEQLMALIREHFTGELIEYATEESTAAEEPAS